jgi:ectoine hydroxylase-related dioxygenase (phytanoyl-CoA dioxygenase family)
MIWPGSHLLPDLDISMESGIPAEMPKGSLCLFLGSTLHAGGANWSSAPRRGLVMSYCLGWLKPCENPWLTYPPEVAKNFTSELGRLIGYRQDAPSLNNVEGRCPSELLTRGPERGRFAETLTDEQQSLIEAFNEMQVEPRVRAA